jgi:hypothetical protein
MAWTVVMPLFAYAPTAQAAGEFGEFDAKGAITLFEGVFASIPATSSTIKGAGTGPYTGTATTVVGRTSACRITWSLTGLKYDGNGGYTGNLKTTQAGNCAGSAGIYNGTLSVHDPNNLGPTLTGNKTGNGAAGGAGGAGGATNGTQQVQCDTNGGFSWLLCGMIRLLLGFVDWVRDAVLTPFLAEPPLDQNDTANHISDEYKIWQIFRNVATVIFILIFFLVIIGQAIGFDNYTIKTVLPRLVAAGVLIPFSWYICAVMIDAGNIAGKGIVQLFESVLPPPSIDFTSNITTVLTSAEFVAAAAAAAGAVWTFSAFTLGSLAIVLLGSVVMLTMRKIIIMLLVVVSPIAIALWILPNTRKAAKNLWWDPLVQLIAMYPVVMGLFMAGRLFALVAPGAFGGSNAQTAIKAGVVPLIQILALYLPLAGVIFAPGWAKKGMGAVSRGVGKVQGAAEKRFGRSSDAAKDSAEERVRRNLLRSRNQPDTVLGRSRSRIARARAGFGGNYMAFGLGRGGFQQRSRFNSAYSKATEETGVLEGQEQASTESEPETAAERVAANRQSQARKSAAERAGRRAQLDNVSATGGNPGGNVRQVYDAARINEGRNLAKESGEQRGAILGNLDNPQFLSRVAGASTVTTRENAAEERGQVHGVLNANRELNAAVGAPAGRMQAAFNAAASTKREDLVKHEGAVAAVNSMEATHFENAASLVSAATSEEREKIAQAKATRTERNLVDAAAPENNQDLVTGYRLGTRESLAQSKADRTQRREVAGITGESTAQVVRAAESAQRDQIADAYAQRSKRLDIDTLAGIGTDQLVQAAELQARESLANARAERLERVAMEPVRTENDARIVEAARANAKEHILEAKADRSQLLAVEHGGTHESDDDLARASELAARDKHAAAKTQRQERVAAETPALGGVEETTDEILEAAAIGAKKDVTRAKAQRLQARKVVDEMKVAAVTDPDKRFSTENLLKAAGVTSYNQEAEEYGNRVGAIKYGNTPAAQANSEELARQAQTRQQGILGVTAGTAKGTIRATDAQIARYLAQHPTSSPEDANSDLIALASQNAAIENQDSLSQTMAQGAMNVKVDQAARQKALSDQGLDTAAYDQALIDHAEVTSRDQLADKAGIRLGELKDMRATGETTAHTAAINEQLQGTGAKAEVAQRAKSAGRKGLARATGNRAPNLDKVGAAASIEAGRQYESDVRKYEGTADAVAAEVKTLMDKDSTLTVDTARDKIVQTAGDSSRIDQTRQFGKTLGTEKGTVSGQASRVKLNQKRLKKSTGVKPTKQEAETNIVQNAVAVANRDAYNQIVGEAAEQRGVVEGSKNNIKKMAADLKAENKKYSKMTDDQLEELAGSRIDDLGDRVDYQSGAEKVADSFGGARGSGEALETAIRQRIEDAKKRGETLTEQGALNELQSERHTATRNSKNRELGEGLGVTKGAVDTAAVAIEQEQRTVQEAYPAEHDITLPDGTIIKKGRIIPVGTVLSSRLDLKKEQRVKDLAGARDRLTRKATKAGVDQGLRAQSTQSGRVAARSQAHDADLVKAGSVREHASAILNSSTQQQLDAAANEAAETDVQAEFAPGTLMHETYDQSLSGRTRVKRESTINQLVDQAERATRIEGIPGVDPDVFRGTPIKNVEARLEDNVPLMLEVAKKANQAGRVDVVQALERKMATTTGSVSYARRLRTADVAEGGFEGNIWNKVDEGQPGAAAILEAWDNGMAAAKGLDIKKPPWAVLAGFDQKDAASVPPGEFRSYAEVFARASTKPKYMAAVKDELKKRDYPTKIAAARAARNNTEVRRLEEEQKFVQSEEFAQAAWWRKREEDRVDALDKASKAATAAGDKASAARLASDRDAAKARLDRYEQFLHYDNAKKAFDGQKDPGRSARQACRCVQGRDPAKHRR